MASAAQPKILSVHLMGGLGNQLFQIFTTIATALENGVAFKFPYSEILATGKHRPTYWDSVFKSIRPFAININLATIPRIVEPEFHYTPIPPINQSLHLYGYFQSPRYFEGQLNKIIRLLRIEEQLAAVRAEFAELLASGQETISLHFRLGDYKTVSAYHPIMPAKYYADALSKFPVSESYRVLYFCEAEDNSTVEATIADLVKQFPAMTFVKVPDSICDWKQMFLMSLCDHHIIANSSFSWWGAYFGWVTRGGGAPPKRVFYPSRWFGPAAGDKKMSDLFPAGWTRIRITT
jgi:hypothetical protein